MRKGPKPTPGPAAPAKPPGASVINSCAGGSTLVMEGIADAEVDQLRPRAGTGLRPKHVVIRSDDLDYPAGHDVHNDVAVRAGYPDPLALTHEMRIKPIAGQLDRRRAAR